MPRENRTRHSVGLRPTPNLERLEERQLLSLSSIGTMLSLPQMQPAIGSSQILPLSSSTVTAVYAPSQIRTAYQINQISGQGQGMTIAIVDAYTQPNIATDINTFSQQFGLPKMDGIGGDPTFSIKVPTGQTAPGYNAGWGIEDLPRRGVGALHCPVCQHRPGHMPERLGR